MNAVLRDKTLLIVGPGLIGGSIARAAHEQRCCAWIMACGRSEEDLKAGLAAGVFDEISTDLCAVAGRADIILIAVPTLAVADILQQLPAQLRSDAVITDAASVKGAVVADARRLLGAAVSRFVPGHPIAGSEQSGFSAARADLFRGRKVILTPEADCEPWAVHLITRLWHAIGADVHGMSVARHDEVLAATSHLPHLLAFTLVNTLARRDADGPAADHCDEQRERLQQVFDYAAGGFADFTRIAGSDPLMWKDIFLTNADASVKVLDDYLLDLQYMREALLRRDGVVMLQAFADARATRNRFMDHFQAARARRDQPVAAVSAISKPGRALGVDDNDAVHLALWLAALSDGVSEIAGFTDAEATLASLQLLRDLGVPVMGPECGQLRVYGTGVDGLVAPPSILMSAPGGSAMAAAVLAAQPFDSVLPAESLPDAVLALLQAVGAQLQTASEPGHLKICAGQALRPAVAQDRRGALALLLAGLFMTQDATLQLPAGVLDERLLGILESFGLKLSGNETAGWQMRCGQRPRAGSVRLTDSD